MLLDKNNSDYENIYFTAGALAKPSALRKFKKVIMVKDKMAFATDGCRLYQAPTTLSNGYYMVLKRNKLQIIIEPTDCELYPDIDPIICQEYPKHIETKGLTDVSNFSYYISAINKTDIIAPIPHVQDALSAGCFDISYKDNRSALLFSDHDKKAYVMPMQPLEP
jgi:hypothetical protein